MELRILIIDDEPAQGAHLARLLAAAGHQASVVSNPLQAATRLGEVPIDLCVTDLALPGIGGFGVIEAARDRAVPVLALVTQGDTKGAVAALRAGAIDIIAKPVNADVLVETITRVLGRSEKMAEGRSRSTHAAAVVTDNPMMHLMLERIDQVADTDAHVLVCGEIGTGKGVVARLVHTSSARGSGPFVAVNIASWPEALADSELFGAAEGSFIGSAEAAAGKFLLARHGTLFLEELAGIPRGTQERIVKLLDVRRIVPPGSERSVPLDVRIIAATQHDPEQLVRDGLLMQELYLRLNVIPIDVPPLRERRQDVALLAERFMRDANLRHKTRVPGFETEVLGRLCAYAWPGNVAELESIVERLVTRARDRMVELADLPSPLRDEAAEMGVSSVDLPPAGVDLRLLLTRLEDRLIGQALARTGGNKNRAAELLGLNRTTLVEKLRRRNVA